MTASIRGIRRAVRFLVLLSFGLFVYFAYVIITNFHQFSFAERDNIQWTVSQGELEALKFRKSLDDHLTDSEQTSIDEVQLRADILLSRLNVIVEGGISEIAKLNEASSQSIQYISDFKERFETGTTNLSELEKTDLESLNTEVQTVQAELRSLGLQIIGVTSQLQRQDREKFQSLLRFSASVGSIVLSLLALSLLFLQNLLSEATRKDTQLSQSTELLSSTISASLDAIVTADHQGRIIAYNESAEIMFGWNRDEILGRLMHQTIIPNEHRKAHVNGMTAYLSTGKKRVIDTGRIEVSALRKNGEVFPVELAITSSIGENGEVFISFIRDISERKKNEQNLIDARNQAETADRAKTQFLTLMSHEMRTPLNGILGVLELMRTTKLSKKQTQYVSIAAASSEILMEQVNEALDINRIESGDMSFQEHAFNIADMIRNLVGVLEPLAIEQGLKLSLQVDPVMEVNLVGDSFRIRQIMTNLIGNAIKFTKEGGIHVHLSGIHAGPNTSIAIDVTDTGVGIDTELYDKIFEDFFALSSTGQRQLRGDGLGLPISRRIARLMGGDIRVKSEMQKGSTFTLCLELPRTTDALETSDAHNTFAQPTRALQTLIVEDNPVNRAVLNDMITSKGHKADFAGNGAVGIELAQKRPYDIIFMDISMPVMDGWEATKIIRARKGPNQRTRILGLTAHDPQQFAEQAKTVGMDNIFGKPIRIATLGRILTNSTFDGWENAQSEAGLNQEVFEELLSVLGLKKTKTSVKKLFNELNDFMSQQEHFSSSGDPNEFEKAAHKMRGGISMFGLTPLVDHLDALAKATQNQDAKAIKKAFDELQNCIQIMKSVVEEKLTEIQ